MEMFALNGVSFPVFCCVSCISFIAPLSDSVQPSPRRKYWDFVLPSWHLKRARGECFHCRRICNGLRAIRYTKRKCTSKKQPHSVDESNLDNAKSPLTFIFGGECRGMQRGKRKQSFRHIHELKIKPRVWLKRVINQWSKWEGKVMDYPPLEASWSEDWMPLCKTCCRPAWGTRLQAGYILAQIL